MPTFSAESTSITTLQRTTTVVPQGTTAAATTEPPTPHPPFTIEPLLTSTPATEICKFEDASDVTIFEVVDGTGEMVTSKAFIQPGIEVNGQTYISPQPYQGEFMSFEIGINLERAVVVEAELEATLDIYFHNNVQPIKVIH